LKKIATVCSITEEASNIEEKRKKQRENKAKKAEKSKAQTVPIFLVYRLENSERGVNKNRYPFSRDSEDSENNAVSAGKTICKQLRKMTGSNV
jgi:uncharacterized protein (DUF1015 family)